MYTIEQYFNIQSITVENIANSSVFQIGTSGVIQSQSHITNPLAYSTTTSMQEQLDSQFVVPLPNPS